MADLYDMNTLLPPEALQGIAQRWGSPAFYAKEYASSANADRTWYIHLYTGRVPSPEEFYYGLYIDRRGDSRSSEAVPLTLAEREIGYFRLLTNGYESYADAYAVGFQALANGAEVAVGVEPSHVDYVSAPRNENSDPSWMLDWSFSASRIVTLVQAEYYSAIIADANNGLLTHNRPTWFMISSSASVPYADDFGVDHPTLDNEEQAYVSVLKHTSVERLPLIMGTVGAIGSGSDLELATGHDGITTKISPVSLRIKCNAI